MAPGKLGRSMPAWARGLLPQGGEPRSGAKELCRKAEDSWLEPFRAGTTAGEQLVQVNGGIFGGVFEAERNFVVAEAGLGWSSVRGDARIAQRAFDFGAQFPPDAVQTARDAGFVRAELAADFGEGLLIGVIETQALFVAWVEQAEGDLQRSSEQGDVAFAVRIRRGLKAIGGAFAAPMVPLGVTVAIVVEFGEATAGADGVNMTLGEHRP